MKLADIGKKKEKKRMRRKVHRPYRILFFMFSMCLWFGLIELVNGRVSDVYHYYTANFDSTTTGKIISHRKSYGRIGSSTLIRYKYKVNDKAYRSYNLSFGGAHETPAKKKYPVGRKVTVHYDSSNPDASTLYVDKISIGLLMAMVLLFLFACATAWLFYPKKLVKKWFLKK